eukprot:6202327-Pleurochrysis_carterae.AAC.1
MPDRKNTRAKRVQLVNVLFQPLASQVVHLSRDVFLQEEEEEEHVEDAELQRLHQNGANWQLPPTRELPVPPVLARVAEAPHHVEGHDEEGEGEGEDVVPLRVHHLGERHGGDAVEERDGERVDGQRVEKDDHIGVHDAHERRRLREPPRRLRRQQLNVNVVVVVVIIIIGS